MLHAINIHLLPLLILILIIVLIYHRMFCYNLFNLIIFNLIHSMSSLSIVSLNHIILYLSSLTSIKTSFKMYLSFINLKMSLIYPIYPNEMMHLLLFLILNFYLIFLPHFQIKACINSILSPNLIMHINISI